MLLSRHLVVKTVTVISWILDKTTKDGLETRA